MVLCNINSRVLSFVLLKLLSFSFVNSKFSLVVFYSRLKSCLLNVRSSLSPLYKFRDFLLLFVRKLTLMISVFSTGNLYFLYISTGVCLFSTFSSSGDPGEIFFTISLKRSNFIFLRLLYLCTLYYFE